MRTFATALLSLLVAACAGSNRTATPPSAVPGGATHPEGVAFDHVSGALFTGSSSDGALYRASEPGERFDPFVDAGRDGRAAAFGMKVQGGRLLVAAGPTGLAYALDPSSGRLLATWEAPTPAQGDSTFLNDLVALPSGDVLVTDSFRPVLWRGRAEGGALTPAVRYGGTALAYESGFNANGIDVSPDGRTVLVAQSSTAQLWRVDLDGGEVSEVALGGGGLQGPDGLRLDPDGRTLYVVDDGAVAVVALQSDLRSGTVERRLWASALRGPTGVDLVPGGLAVVNAQFDTDPVLPFTVAFLDGPSSPDSAQRTTAPSR